MWNVLDACLTVMEELQEVYSRLGDNENKKAVAEEAEDLEKEVNNVIEKAEQVIKDILKKKTCECKCYKRDIAANTLAYVTCSINAFACPQPVVKFRSFR